MRGYQKHASSPKSKFVSYPLTALEYAAFHQNRIRWKPTRGIRTGRVSVQEIQFFRQKLEIRVDSIKIRTQKRHRPFSPKYSGSSTSSESRGTTRFTFGPTKGSALWLQNLRDFRHVREAQCSKHAQHPPVSLEPTAIGAIIDNNKLPRRISLFLYTLNCAKQDLILPCKTAS